MGGGREAREKAGSLADLGARVIVSDARHELTGELSERHGVELHTGPFDPALLDGVFLVIAANDDRRRAPTGRRHRARGGHARQRGRRERPLRLGGAGDPAPRRAHARHRHRRDRARRSRSACATALPRRFGPELGTLLELFGEVRPRIMASGRSFRGPAPAVVRAGRRRGARGLPCRPHRRGAGDDRPCDRRLGGGRVSPGPRLAGGRGSGRPGPASP